MNLEELFQEYKDTSLNIIKILEDDIIEQLDSEFEKRDKILAEISKLNENKEVLRKYYKEYELFKIDEEIKLKINLAMKNVKIEMMQIQKRKDANISYNNINARSIYLSKKI